VSRPTGASAVLVVCFLGVLSTWTKMQKMRWKAAKSTNVSHSRPQWQCYPVICIQVVQAVWNLHVVSFHVTCWGLCAFLLYIQRAQFFSVISFMHVRTKVANENSWKCSHTRCVFGCFWRIWTRTTNTRVWLCVVWGISRQYQHCYNLCVCSRIWGYKYMKALRNQIIVDL